MLNVSILLQCINCTYVMLNGIFCKKSLKGTIDILCSPVSSKFLHGIADITLNDFENPLKKQKGFILFCRNMNKTI